MLPKLQYISQGNDPDEHLKNIRCALDAGLKLVQLRLKNIPENIYVEYGIKAKELCSQYNAILIINDQPQVAAQCNSEALHLGLNDMAIEQARKIIPGKIIGGTANTFEHVKARCAENVDYIGLGPFRFTKTKEKLSPVLGIEGYRELTNKMKKENLSTPVYAIGGIEREDIKQIIATGVYGIAVSGLLTGEGKNNLVKEINKILDHA